MQIRRSLELCGGAAVVYLVLAACSATQVERAGQIPEARADGAPAPESGVSTTAGSRLRPTRLNASDGASMPWMFLDTARRERCSFHEGPDGVVRCLPPYTSTSSFYADSACKRELVLEARGCAPRTYAVSRSEGCAPVDRFHQVGARHAGKVFSKSSEGACTPSTVSDVDLYVVDGDIMLDEFVSATIEEL